MQPSQSSGPDRGVLSQESGGPSRHRKAVGKAVTASSIDPAARAGRGFYHALSASSVGLELGIAVTLGIATGIYLDAQAGTTPWLMLVFLGFGFAAGFRGVLRAVRRSDRAAARELGLLGDSVGDPPRG